MNRSKLSQQQADDVEFEMRQLESNPRTTTLQMRLFMQSTMPCGHAVGNLLTCDRPPNGCVICGSEAAVDADITTMELCRFVLAIWDLYHDGRLKFEWRDADKHDDVIEWLNEAQRVAMIQYQRILIEPCAAP